jgi:hypothetical protein
MMKRVSSRQRLVSWDAFDAAAVAAPFDGDSDFSEFAIDNNEVNSITSTSDDDAGYDTALEDSNSSCHYLTSNHDSSMVGHKRDRSTRRAEQQQQQLLKGISASSASSSSFLKSVSSPPHVSAASTLSALLLFLSFQVTHGRSTIPSIETRIHA